ncbi:hypothetical protein [Spirosoma sp.]|uniref:hypothetical protein n=1 Tax=Spirosoma sp. TaxID=1899569 RepID=UPI003B3AFD23
MLPLMSKLAISALLSASSLINPTNPQKLSFNASAYVTAKNEIRMAVEKTTAMPVVVMLRNKNNEILYHKNIWKKETKYAAKLDVSELADGQYVLEIASREGSIKKELNVSTQSVQQTNRLVAMQ